MSATGFLDYCTWIVDPGEAPRKCFSRSRSNWNVCQRYTWSIQDGWIIGFGFPWTRGSQLSFASSRYVLYLELAIACLNIDYSSTKTSPRLSIRETLAIFSTVPTMHSRSLTVEPRECLVELWWIAGAWTVPYASWPKRRNEVADQTPGLPTYSRPNSGAFRYVRNKISILGVALFILGSACYWGLRLRGPKAFFGRKIKSNRTTQHQSFSGFHHIRWFLVYLPVNMPPHVWPNSPRKKILMLKERNSVPPPL